MGLFDYFLNKYKFKVQERNNSCEILLEKIDAALKSIEIIFDTKNFIEPRQATVLKSQNDTLLTEIQIKNISHIKKALHYKQLLTKRMVLIEKLNSLPHRIQIHNDKITCQQIESIYDLIGNIEGHKLDNQQMNSIARDIHNHLIIAGAGTGKTTTIIGKIKYLLKSKQYEPKDILVISFTNASATEMRQRIKLETGFDVNALTFHKLGLNIISSVEQIMPKITHINLKAFIKEQLLQQMQSNEYFNVLLSYLLYNRIIPKSEFDFSTFEEYNEYLTLNPPTTINNEKVKSYGEMDIANFLTLNGIKYVYENPYEIDTRTSEYGQYYPDFYLPEYNIYIEYFGINRNGEVPSYFKSKNGLSASQEYQKSMLWKRKLHNDNKTTMIEFFAYEKFEGILLDELKSKLQLASVNLNPQTNTDFWDQLFIRKDSMLESIVELFEALINLIKSNEYDFKTIKDMNKHGMHYQSNNMLLFLLEPIFNAYCKHLDNQKEIDFSDMINFATHYIKEGKYVNPYKYVIVDEYQDISKACFNMLSNLRRSKDFKLFCVGDDWQSIYRFAGSDIGFILNFSKYWGESEISKIENTYRFSQKLIEISSNFIMKNPIQIKKHIIGNQPSIGFPLEEINGYTEKYAIKFMIQKLNDIPRGSSVFFIGRYSSDVKLLSDNSKFTCHYNNVDGVIEVTYSLRLDLKMIFLTAHKSKGLQADYIFILNNKNGRLGFPSKIQDAPIFELLLENYDQFPYAEERRLYYVSLTRAKKKVYIITINGQESEFAMELKNNYNEELQREKFTCPICGGRLLKKTGPYGDFFGCSNYHTTGCQYKRKIVSLQEKQLNTN